MGGAITGRNVISRMIAELGDITTCRSDAIVNAANSALAGGGGVDGAIHSAGGPTIAEECAEIIGQIGTVETGHAVTTSAGSMPSKFVVHAVGPIWDDHAPGDADALLASAYRQSLIETTAQSCRTVAFPNISTGVYGFPKPRAAGVAVSAVAGALDELVELVELEQVTFICFDEENYDLYLERLEQSE